MEIDRSKPVLVTGGNGYIASWIVKYLLEDGIDVHATVRDPKDDKKVGHLKAIAENAPGKLTLFKADLLEDGVFDDAMAGCELVMHTASPFVIMGIKDPQKELVDPAVKGTRNVLTSATQTDSVKRVVLTSSVVGIYGDAVDIEQTENGVFTEEHWNTTSSVNHQPYNFSKVAAEKAAWEIANGQNRWDMLTINPGLVVGPSLTNASASGSFSTIKQFYNGSLKMGAPKMELGIVDVRDVAQAHIKAGFTPSASGRHICVSESQSFLQIGKILRKAFGDKYPFPRSEVPKFMVWLVAPMSGITRPFVSKNVGYPLRFDNSYTRKDLGIEFRPAEESLVEFFQQLIDDGVVKDKR
ncbi:MAG: NAD-dependent epimerase/dehydratase family protein [Salinisphaeraceae bacterium]|nr:NAD-dependent epimerase/dehydratase family protein [Salinisphaeraceae bacterium]